MRATALSRAAILALIASALVSPRASAQATADDMLKARVEAALAAASDLPADSISVQVQGGVVTLEGTTALDRAVEVARTVPGVRDVRTQQVEIPPIPPFVA